MLIKRFTSDRFAGLKEIDVEFSEGLNVMLGPNESGKSTIIEGIYATLFKAPALRMNVKSDKEFCNRFMPHPDGDAIDGEIVICVEGEEYRLKKQWGAKASLQLLTPQGSVIKDIKTATEAINKILKFGPGTYSNVVFAKQRDIKRALGKILSDNTSREVSKILMRAMMELDGISVDELGERIKDEKDRLLKRWDIDRNCPQNNKGINDPYKTGLGEVLKAFYHKERTKLFMNEVREMELEFEKICEELKDKEAENKRLKLNIDELAKIEGDMIQRLVLEPKLEGLKRQNDILTKIYKDWPEKKNLIKKYENELKEIVPKIEALEKEKENLQRVQRRIQLVKKLKVIEELTKKVHKLRDRIKGIKVITDEDIKNLEGLREAILKIDTAIDAGVIKGKFKRLDKDIDIAIITDLKEERKAKEKESFVAKGYMKIKSAGFELELKAGELDYEKLKNDYDKYKLKIKKLLKNLGAGSIEEVKSNKEVLATLKADEENKIAQINLLLGDEEYGDLKKELQRLKDLGEARNIDEINSDIKTLQNMQTHYKVKKVNEENDLKKWATEYKDQDNVFEMLIEGGVRLREIQKELAKLAPIPEEFKSAQDFKNSLSQLREAYEKGQQEYDRLKGRYYQYQRDLPDSTYEEIKVEYEEGVATFNKNIRRAQKLHKIYKAFERVKAGVGREPFKPLAETFTEYLHLLTDGNYEQGQIDENFKMRLKNKEGVTIPPLLLSSGTHDCVALALRFSILQYIYGPAKGYVVLDDCIVDLDPTRKRMAVQLIRQYAKDNQVIFVTCDPETAKLLGGNIIKIKVRSN